MLRSLRVDLVSLQRGVFFRPFAPATSSKLVFAFADELTQLAAQQDRRQFHFSIVIHCFDLFAFSHFLTKFALTRKIWCFADIRCLSHFERLVQLLLCGAPSLAHHYGDFANQKLPRFVQHPFFP